MASISLLDSLPDHFRLLWCTIAHRVEQRQRWLAFVQVIADVFTERFAIRAVVQQIINQLERGAEVTAIVLKAFFLRFATASQNARALRGGFEQTCGLAVNHPHIVFFGDVRVVDVHQAVGLHLQR